MGGDILGATAGDAADITLDAGTGTLTVLGIGANGSTLNTEINDVALTAATIKTNGIINTTGNSNDAGGITLTGAVVLAGNTTLDTDTSGGDITIDGDGGIDATNAGTQTLTISSGAGNIDIQGIIGDTTAVGDIDINAATAGTGDIKLAQIGQTDLTSGVTGTVDIGTTTTDLIDFNGRYFSMDGALTVTSKDAEVIKFTGAGATTVKTADDAISFVTGTILTGQNLTINSTGGTIAIASVMSSGTDIDLTINADNSAGGSAQTDEKVTIGAIGTADEIGAVTIDAHDGITLTGDIKLADAADADLDLDGPVFINGNVTIDVDNTTNDGTVHFESTVDGADGTGDNLTIKVGDTAANGSLTITTSIGDTTALSSL